MTINPGPGSDAMGGGISNSPFATMNMTNCTVANNHAIAGHGAAGVNTNLLEDGLPVPAGFGFGGGIDTSRGSTANITGSLISGNSAIGGAGGSGNTGGDGFGGGLGVGWGTLLGGGLGLTFGSLVGYYPDGSQVNLVDSVVIGNVALGGTGGVGANGGDGHRRRPGGHGRLHRLRLALPSSRSTSPMAAHMAQAAKTASATAAASTMKPPAGLWTPPPSSISTTRPRAATTSSCSNGVARQPRVERHLATTRGSFTPRKAHLPPG